MSRSDLFRRPQFIGPYWISGLGKERILNAREWSKERAGEHLDFDEEAAALALRCEGEGGQHWCTEEEQPQDAWPNTGVNNKYSYPVKSSYP